MNLDDSLRDKITANGAFEETANLAQGLKFILRRGKNWEAVGPESKEALEQISTKIAMILNGDANEARHWNAIAGYARLRGKALEQGAIENSVSRLARLRTQAPNYLAPAQDDAEDA